MSNLKRVNISVTEEQDKKLREMGKSLGVNRSIVIRIIIEEHFKQKDYLEVMKDLKSLETKL